MTPSYDPITILLNAGVSGVMVVLLLTRRIVTKGELDAVTAELERVRVKSDAQEAALTEKVLPALIHATDVITRVERDRR